jgi:hypothetical protein
VAAIFDQQKVIHLLKLVKKNQVTPFLLPYEIQVRIFDYLGDLNLILFSIFYIESS